MGYEISFSYYETDASGELDKENAELKTKVIKIGQSDELVPMERVAATVIKEYTKRHIWVERVEIAEWVKKPLKFAQTKNGVKIGAQSFNLGLNEIMKWAVDDTPTFTPQPQQQPQPQFAPPQPQFQQQHYTPTPQLVLPQPTHPQPPLPQMPQQPLYENREIGGTVSAEQEYQMSLRQGTYAASPQQAHPGFDPREGDRIVRQQPRKSMAGLQYGQRLEVCDPPPELRADLANMNLTIGKRYYVLSEQLAQNGHDYLYRIVDDAGKERLVGWHYFRQPQAVRQEESYFDPRTGMLHTVAKYVDQAAVSAQNYEQRPRLLYENDGPYRSVAQTSADPTMNGMLAKMDAAVRRRTGAVR